MYVIASKRGRFERVLNTECAENTEKRWREGIAVEPLTAFGADMDFLPEFLVVSFKRKKPATKNGRGINSYN